MTAIILRRKNLGKNSCKNLAEMSAKIVGHVLNNKAVNISEAPTVVFRWGCISPLPLHWGQSLVINKARAITWAADKKISRLHLKNVGVNVPSSWTVSPAGQIAGEVNVTAIMDGTRFIARPSRHARGKNLFVAENLSEAASYCGRLGGGYVSTFIPKIAEYRVMIVQNRVAWVAQKLPADSAQVAWNLCQGAQFINVRWSDWPMKVIAEALKAFNVSGLDFCAADVIVGPSGEAYVLELNTAPTHNSSYRGQCTARCFDYLIQNGRESLAFLDTNADSTWRHVIHPAILERT